MNYGYIYKTINKIDDKVYIGKCAKSFNPNYFGSGYILKKAIAKYGIINFKVELIVYASSETELNALEKFYIAQARKLLRNENVYNVTEGGDGFGAGENHPSFGKKRIHEVDCKCCFCRAKRGELKGECSYAHGKTHSLKTKKKMSKARIGIKHTLNCQCFFCKTKRGGRKGEKHLFYCMKWVSNSQESIRIKEEDVRQHLNKGWQLGRRFYIKNIVKEVRRHDSDKKDL